MIELITIFKTNQNWYLNKVFVNSEHIMTIAESVEHNSLLKEGKISLPLSESITFSIVRMDPKTGFKEFVVVGSPTMILEKMKHNKKQLLKG